MKDLKFAITIGDKKLNCIYVCTTDLAERCIQALLTRSTPVLGFDIETGKKANYVYDPVAGLCPYRSFPSLVQFYDGIDRCYMFDTFYLPLAMLAPIFAAKRVIAHNAIFDLQHMKHNGLDVPNMDCSMIMYNLVKCAEFASFEEEDEAEGEGEVTDWLGKGERYGASLRVCVAKLLGIRVDKELQTSNWTERPLSKEQLAYAAQDSWFTFDCGRVLSRKIKELGLAAVYRLNREALEPVTDMILNGISIDVEKHVKCCKEWEKERDRRQLQVLKHFGSLTNVRSTHHISKWLEANLPIAIQHKWPRSEKTGKLRSDAKSLSSFSELSFVKPLLEYKKLDRLLSSFGPTLLAKINPITKRLHGSYTLGYTATGRLSSRSPNVQQLPRGEEIRSIFIAGTDKVLVGGDYSQIELRVAAELSQDKAMLAVYKKGLDLHSYMASQIAGKPLDKVTKEERQLGKALNFGLAFGLGAKGLVDYAAWNYNVKLTEEQAYQHVRTFFDTYSGYAAWQKVQRDIAAKTNLTTTVTGKVRKLLPDRAYTRSVNTPVQGTASEIVITALNMLHKKLDNKMIRLLVSVHDELILETHKSKVKEAKELLGTTMTEAYLKLFPRGVINKLVDVKSGQTWAALK